MTTLRQILNGGDDVALAALRDALAGQDDGEGMREWLRREAETAANYRARLASFWIWRSPSEATRRDRVQVVRADHPINRGGPAMGVVPLAHWIVELPGMPGWPSVFVTIEAESLALAMEETDRLFPCPDWWKDVDSYGEDGGEGMRRKQAAQLAALEGDG